MSNEISKFAGAGLPSVQSLASSLRKIEAEVGPIKSISALGNVHLFTLSAIDLDSILTKLVA